LKKFEKMALQPWRHPIYDFPVAHWDQAMMHSRQGMMDSMYRDMQDLKRSMDSMISQTKSRAAKEVVNDDWKFQVNVDVRQFSPEEVNVKTSNNEIFVEAKHEEKADEHGFVQRSFSRRYVLPADADSQGITSRMSNDGILTIEAPKKGHTMDSASSRSIPIQKM